MANFWKKVFGKKKQKGYAEEDTIPLSVNITSSREDEITQPLMDRSSIFSHLENNSNQLGLEPAQLLASCAQSIGRQRDHNEDALFCLTTTLATNKGVTPFGMYIVADGMGGHQNGEVASEIAIRTMASYVLKKLFINLISMEQQPPEEPLQDIMKKGVQMAHDNILDQVTGGGTTLTTVTIIGNQMTISHVGDSRVYAVSVNGLMKPLTRDHSLVKRLEELGQLTPEEAAVDPRRNVLYHALGQGTPIEPEIISAPLPHPGYLLICSDGLWGVISEESISKIILSAETLPAACQELVDAANEAGGPDNITAVLVRMPD